MAAFMILALGACVVSILVGLSEVWAAPISRPEPEAKRLPEPVKPQLPPEVMAVLRRNALRDDRGGPLDPDARKNGKIRLAGDETRSAPSFAGQTLSWSAIVRTG
jgi:hypothetical protein